MSRAPVSQFPDYLVIRDRGRTIRVTMDEIDWIDAADYYARIHARGRAMLIRETMASLEARLDPVRFLRVHRSAIVNVARVKELRTAPKGEHALVLSNGRCVPVNRTRKKAVEQRLRLTRDT